MAEISSYKERLRKEVREPNICVGISEARDDQVPRK